MFSVDLFCGLLAVILKTIGAPESRGGGGGAQCSKTSRWYPCTMGQQNWFQDSIFNGFFQVFERHSSATLKLTRNYWKGNILNAEFETKSISMSRFKNELVWPEKSTLWIQETQSISYIYLNYKVSPFAVPKHVNGPISLGPDLVPNRGKANLISRSKPVNFVEPKTSKKIRNRNVFTYYNTSFRHICHKKIKKLIPIISFKNLIF